MTDRYCVLGNPVAHSLSPAIHARFAEQCGQDMQYEAILAPLDGFSATVAQFVAAGGQGANVTVPFKTDAYDWVDEHSERARTVEAIKSTKPAPQVCSCVSGTDRADRLGAHFIRASRSLAVAAASEAG